MPDITESFLQVLIKLLELSSDLRNNRLDHIEATIRHIERRQLFMVEALRALLRGQADEATIAALTSKINTEADKVESAVESQMPQTPPNS